MTPQSKAREYWLKFAEAYGDEDQIFDEKSDHHQKQIHVIEFEAYDKAVEALKVAQKENEKLLKFKEAALELLQEMSKIQGYENWYTSAAKRILEMKDHE